MNTKIRYDLDSLELANGDFGYPITEKEVRKVNRMLELMENVRNRQMCPTEGDCVEFVSRSGDYFGKAHIERITGKYADICLIPETVFCFDDMGKAAYDTTGSPWTQVNIRNMKPAGTEIRIFRTWGFGKRSNTGSLRFDAPVRKWEYREPNPLYDGYTTRNWQSRLVTVKRPSSVSLPHSSPSKVAFSMVIACTTFLPKSTGPASCIVAVLPSSFTNVSV